MFIKGLISSETFSNKTIKSLSNKKERNKRKKEILKYKLKRIPNKIIYT